MLTQPDVKVKKGKKTLKFEAASPQKSDSELQAETDKLFLLDNRENYDARQSANFPALSSEQNNRTRGASPSTTNKDF